jgi:hypothetical protein
MQGRIKYISPDKRFLFIEPTEGPKLKLYGHRKTCVTSVDLLEIGHLVYFTIKKFKGKDICADIDTLPPVILAEASEPAAETLANLETEAPAVAPTSAAATFVPFRPTRDCAQAPAAGIPACALKILAEPDARSL